VRFSGVQLGDLGGSYPADSKWAREGTPVGAPMWSSPEVIMETRWNTATDIWSFGTVVCFERWLENNNDLNANLQTLLAADQSHIRREIQPVPPRHGPLRPRRVRLGDSEETVPLLRPVSAKLSGDREQGDRLGYSLPHAGNPAVANDVIVQGHRERSLQSR